MLYISVLPTIHKINYLYAVGRQRMHLIDLFGCYK